MLEFHSLADAAKHLTNLKLENQHDAMEEACLIIEHKAKELIGTYQAEEAPFGAWPELAESTKEDRVRQGYSENEPLLRSGDMRDHIDHLAAHTIGVIGSDQEKALAQELGTARIPPRSFLGMAAMMTGEQVANTLGRGVMGMMVGGGAGAFVKKLNP